LKDDVYRRLAGSIRSLVPDLSLDAEEMQAEIEERGLDSFIQNIDGTASELAEIAELLSRLEKRGGRRE
jgi:hypothetical protein